MNKKKLKRLLIIILILMIILAGGCGYLFMGSKITDAYIFAGGPGQKPISVAHFLEGKTGIPASQWRKAQGHGVVLNAGAQKGAVLHWFEANGEMYSVKVVKWE